MVKGFIDIYGEFFLVTLDSIGGVIAVRHRTSLFEIRAGREVQFGPDANGHIIGRGRVVNELRVTKDAVHLSAEEGATLVSSPVGYFISELCKKVDRIIEIPQ